MKIKRHFLAWGFALAVLTGLSGCTADDDAGLVAPELPEADNVIDAAYNHTAMGRGRWLYTDEYSAESCTTELDTDKRNIYYWIGEPIEIADTLRFPEGDSLWEHFGRKVMTREQAHTYIRVAEDNSMWYNDQLIVSIVPYNNPAAFVRSFLKVELSEGTAEDELKAVVEKIGGRCVTADYGKFYSNYIYIPMDSPYNVFQAAEYIYKSVHCVSVRVVGLSYEYPAWIPSGIFDL